MSEQMISLAIWFKEQYERDRESAIAYLIRCAIEQPESVIWDYLEKTGEPQYTILSFQQVATMLCKEAEQAQNDIQKT